MNGPEHYRVAEQLCVRADDVLDADYGWMASLSTEERLARRAADLADAQVHATLALAAATAGQNNGKWMHPSWQDVLVSDTDRGRQENPDQQEAAL